MGNERGRLIASVESRSVPREGGGKEKLIHSFINAENGKGEQCGLFLVRSRIT